MAEQLKKKKLNITLIGRPSPGLKGVEMNNLKCKIISISLIIFLFSILYSGCIEQNVNNGNNNQNEISFQEKIMNLSLSTIALTSLDVEINQLSSKHITEPYDFENAAGAG